MSKKKLASLVRAILTIGGTYAVTTGTMDADGLNQVIGAGTALGSIVWGQIAAHKATKLEKASQ